MSSVTEVPEPWASAMIAAGFTDPRYSREIPSRRALAEAAETTTSTISAMIAGTRDTDPRIVQRVAVALKMKVRADEVARWVGDARTAAKPFQPHRDADLLTSDEQEAVNELIRLLALPKKRGGRAHGNATTTTKGSRDPDTKVRHLKSAARDVGRPPSLEGDEEG